MVNNKVKDGDPPGSAEGVLHMPVRKVLFRSRPVVHQPNRLLRLTTVPKHISTLANLMQNKIMGPLYKMCYWLLLAIVRII